MKLSFTWVCGVSDSSCSPEIEVERIDSESEELPFLMNTVFHYKDANGTTLRDYYRHIGVKVILLSKGLGR
jgi:hypothetical protein